MLRSGRSRRPLSACLLLACTAWSVPRAARAREVSGNPPVPPAAPATAARAISSAQVDAFTDLLGEDREVVEQRLLWNPGMVSYAAAAADARLERKGQGKALMIAGFTLLGGGSAVGLAVALSGPLICFDEACQRRQDESTRAGETIMLASVGLGLLLAIPGIVKMAHQSESETQAVRYYQSTEAGRPLVFPADRPRPLSGPPARAFSAPLVSFSF
jgi:hypothetical protein